MSFHDNPYLILSTHLFIRMIRHAQGDPSNPEVRFYQNMSNDLFCNVRVLYEQIDAHFEDGTPIESLGSQMAVSDVQYGPLFLSLG